jgi:tetratricopeptide (TPR) repeat protein
MQGRGGAGASGDLAAVAQRAAALLSTDPAQAAGLAREILRTAPRDPRGALILASARRLLGDPKGASDLLEPLAKAYPRAAHTHYELGLARADLGDVAAAVEALRHATNLKPDLAEAWRALGDGLFRLGDAAGAEQAFAELARASVRDPKLKPAADDLFAGRLEVAEQRLRAHLAAYPSDTIAANLLADALIRQSRYAEAEEWLAHVLRIDPAFEGARFNYATALFRQQKAVLALAEVERLLAKDAGAAPYRNLQAACLSLVGEDERVAEIHADLLAEFPRQPGIWLNHAHALRTVGRGEESLAAYRRSIALAPWLGDAYWGLANLKVATFTDEDLAAMLGQVARSELSNEDRLHFHYALGKALEDRGEFADSFRHYSAGAALRRAQVAYDPEATTLHAAKSKALFSKTFIAERRGAGSPSAAPVFVVGLPRSGSTLVEQILASHSAVEGTLELPDLSFIARTLDRDGRYPGVLSELNPARVAEIGEAYLDQTRVYRKLDRPFFIDKMPNNFQHIGLIHLILPQAKIIDVRRHPMAACFSAFKQLFAQGQAFSYDLVDLGRYYADYVDLMAHFDAVLPGRVHRVIYEDLVEDTEAEVHRLLTACGLPFEDACLRFYENDRAVRTVSSEQVRRPIFREGLAQWRRYEPWLEPLARALGPALHDWRGAASAGFACPIPVAPSLEVAHGAQPS